MQNNSADIENIYQLNLTLAIININNKQGEMVGRWDDWPSDPVVELWWQ